MKILSYLCLSLFILNLTSCSSNDDGDNPPINPNDGTLLGSWNATEFTIDGSFSEAGTDAEFSMFADHLDGNTLVFNEDGTVTGDNAPFEMETTIFINGVALPPSTQIMSEVMSHSGTWSQDGNTLTLLEDGSNDPQVFTIEILSPTTLKISGNQDSLGDTGNPSPGTEFLATVTYSR